MASKPLSAEERHRFATWLEMDAATDDELSAQMEKTGIHAHFIFSRKSDAKAKRRVAQLLWATDSVEMSR